METTYQIEQLAGDNNKSKHSPSPVFNTIAEYHKFPHTYQEYSGNGRGAVEFKRNVKQYMISLINESVEKYAKRLPFLIFDLPEDTGENFFALTFGKDLQNFMNERNIAQVYAYKGDTSYIIPLGLEQLTKRTKEKLVVKGGFEVNLAYASMQRMLYDLAHEMAHTFFYDISSDSPTSLISDQILSKPEWHQEFEGLAFDFGREIWLPRKEFSAYVKNKCEKPSIDNFLKIHSELYVGIDPLAQRLLHDLKLWKALTFWGTAYRKIDNFDNNEKEYFIHVRQRDRRRNGFDSIHLDKDLKSTESELRKTMIEHLKSGARIGKYSLTIGNKEYSFDVSSKKMRSGEDNFIAMLYRN